MKTEAEIAKKYKILMQTGSKNRQDEKVLFAQIDLLLWILKCELCERYPCNCDEPF